MRPMLFYIVLIALVSISCAKCEQLSTVFVLETSDPNGESGVNEKNQNNQKASDESNTRIVTDDGSQNENKPNKVSQLSHLKADSPVVMNHNHQHNNQGHNGPPLHSSSGHQDRSAKIEPDVTKARRLTDESQPPNAQRSTTNRNSVQSQPVNQPRTRSTTSSSVNDGDQDQSGDQSTSSSTPKTQERLLISITSDDDDYKPIIKQPFISGGLGGLIGTSGGSLNEEQPSNQKRKPSITISIQDANKVTGGSGSSGSPSVILRPSENGQSIVISTVDSNSNNNKPYNQNKPIVLGSNNDSPYSKEPTDGGSSHQHHIPVSTTTHRPHLVSNNNNNDQNHHHNHDQRPVSSSSVAGSHKPLVSTLVDTPIRPSLNEEQPQRPSGGSILDSGSRPSRPNQDSLQPSSTGGNYDPDSDRPSGQPESKYPLNERNCGLMQETKIVGGEEADPDDFLWMAAIIRSKPTSSETRPFCGGSLITRRHILTAAHCLENLAPRDVLVRLGSYDFDDATASSLSADYAIDQFRVPANYTKKTHVADIAIMRLKTPLSISDNYKTVCMPQPRRSYVGALGTVTGYGSQSTTFRRAAPKLRQVTVPIWENRKCSNVYKRNLTESFLCAGYEEGGKDACQGDSGGPLMTEGPNERLMVVGIVSHGIGCGSPGYPGVYTRTTTFMEWIEKNTRE